MPRGSVSRLRRLANTDRLAELEDRIGAMQTEFGVEIGKLLDSRQAYMNSLEQERARLKSKTAKVKQLRARLQEQADASDADRGAGDAHRAARTGPQQLLVPSSD